VSFTFTGGVDAELQFLNWMALQGGLNIGIEDPNYDYKDIIDEKKKVANYRTSLLSLRFLLKFPLKPGGNTGKNFMIEPYGGVAYNIALGGDITPSDFSWMAGLDYGVRVGGGCLFIGLQYGMDFFKTKLNPDYVKDNYKITEYDRIFLSLVLGYKYGFFTRPTRLSEK
jgi:hypothetical protein